LLGVALFIFHWGDFSGAMGYSPVWYWYLEAFLATALLADVFRKLVLGRMTTGVCQRVLATDHTDPLLLLARRSRSSRAYNALPSD
jgi:hypothetical protein